MALRLLQFYTQVVATSDRSSEDLRVRRLYADVLVSDVGSGVVPESANNAMTLNQSVGFVREFNVSASSTLNMQQTAGYKFDEQEVAHSLNLSQVAVGVREIPLSASSTMSLVSLGGRVFEFSASNTMVMTDLQTHFNYVGDRQPVGNVMVLTQCVQEKSSRFLTHDLGLTQTVDIVFPIKPVIIQHMALTQHSSTPHRAFISDFMYLTQQIGLVLPVQHVTSTMNLISESPIGRFEQTLNLTQTACIGYHQSPSHNLGITDSVQLEAIFVRSVNHSNFIGHSLTWYEEQTCGEKQYTPFQGENTVPASTYTAPPDTLQDPQGDTGNFSVYTPYLGVPSSKVVLRNPEMDNRDRNAYTRVNEETRGGKLIVFSDPTWPHIRTLAVTIIGLTEAKVDEFQDFLLDTLGQEIGLTDWEGRLWKGVVTNPDETATQDGKRGWTVTFEFEGEMLNVQQPEYNGGDGQRMSMSQTVTAVIT